MNRLSTLGLGAICSFLAGCATLPPGWAEYREATKCHLQNKNEECDKAYEKAIKKNSKLPGLHASYGSHLFRRGDAAAAKEHFNEELENHPHSRPAILVVYRDAPDSASATAKVPKGGE